MDEKRREKTISFKDLSDKKDVTITGCGKFYLGKRASYIL